MYLGSRIILIVIAVVQDICCFLPKRFCNKHDIFFSILPFILNLQPPGYPLIDDVFAVPDAGEVAHGVESVAVRIPSPG